MTSIYRIDQALYLPNTTTSSSKSTGALTVTGGIATLDNVSLGGYLSIQGTTNAVSIKVQAGTAAYNYNLPSSAGTSGQILTSGGGSSSPNTWTSTTGTGNVVLSSGPTFGAGGLTSTAGTTTLGATTIGAITGTSATYSTTLGVTGLTTLSGGLTSTAGATTLGATTIGAITGTSATFSSTLGVTGLATFGSGGLTSITGTNTLGSGTNFSVTNGTAPFTVASSTNIPNLNASTLNGATFAVPGAIGGTTPGTGSFTSISTNSTTTSTFSTPLSTISYAYPTSFFAPNATKPGIILGVNNTDTNYAAINYQTDDSLNISIGTATDLLKVSRSGNMSNTGTFSTTGVLLRGSTSGIISILPQAVAGTYNYNLPTTAGSAGQVLTSQGGGSTAMTWTTPSSGTITSIALAVPPFLSISGSPLTTNGTLTIGLSGTALDVANGGTGQTTLTSNAVLLGNSTSGIQSPSTITYASSTLTLPKIISNDSTASSSSTTGSILLSGGLGISNTTDATSATSGGTVTTAGGVGIAKKLFVGTTADITGNTSTAGVSVRGALGTVNILPQSTSFTSYNLNLPTTAGLAGQVLSSSGGGSSPMTWVASSSATPESFTTTGANNQSSPADVTGLVYTSGKFDISMTVQVVATTSLTQLYKLSGIKSPSSSWNMTSIDVSGDITGVIFTITSGGQIQYTSLNYTGFTSISFTWEQFSSTQGTSYLALSGAGNVVTISPSTGTSTYNYNLPTTAGTSGQFLTSGGGSSSPNTWTSPLGTGFVSLTSVGTYTPTCVGSTSGSATLSSPVGSYQVIGNLCFFWCQFSISSSTAVGNIRVSLPFTVRTGYTVQSVFSVQLPNITLPGGTTYAMGQAVQGNTYFEVFAAPSFAGVPVPSTGFLWTQGFFPI